MLLKQSSGINTGVGRSHAEPMQVVSGAVGKENIHFEGPPSVGAPGEMHTFIEWFNDRVPGGKNEIFKPPVRQLLICIFRPYILCEDGNGRIGRAVAEKHCLKQQDGRCCLAYLNRS